MEEASCRSPVWNHGDGDLVPDDRFLHRRAGHSEKVSSLSDLEYRVWTQYMLSADDFGILSFSAAALQADNSALERRSSRSILAALTLLVTCGLLRKFDHQRRSYVFQHDWQDWQKVRWPAKTIHPIPPTDEMSKATIALFRIFPGGSQVPPKSAGGTSEVLQSTREMANGLRLTADGSLLRREEDSPPFDVWFSVLKSQYPKQAVSAGILSEQAFHTQLSQFQDGPVAGWALMQANLDNQKAGYQWRVKQMIPKLEKWLREGLWLQQHEVTPIATVVTDRTARTLTSAAEFAKGGES